MLIDTHCHLDFERFNEDRHAVIERALHAGIQRMIVPGIDLKNCTAVLKLTEQYDNVYAAVGVHPNSTANWQDDWIDELRQLATHEKVVAIGEIGLDNYWDKSPQATQRWALRPQLKLAAELNLPVIIHNREANEDIIRVLAESPLAGHEGAGVLHSFSGDWGTASAALQMGFYLGFTGPLTYKKSAELRWIAGKVPDERILVETDAPFLTPEPYRGQRNEPAYVVQVAAQLAEIKNVSTAVIAQQTTENAMRLFWQREKQAA
ncbi:MAG: TatD family hydrolase [Ardenticatenaceae bacterium]|nr:TatD family hydrolase [Ardenticatenaceae bacterium]MCB9445571.1 TatD family hydrolase [Ardenticatenaceae bacterium]